MNNIKVAMLSDSFFPVKGGREVAIDNIMKNISKTNTCFLCAPKFNKLKSSVPVEYKVYRCNSLSLSKNEVLSIANKTFKKEVESNKFDILHLQTKYGLASYAIKLKKKFNVPLVSSVHTNYPKLYKKQIKFPLARAIALLRVKHVLSKSDHIITVSPQMQDTLISMGIKTPISVIPNGCDFIYPENPQLFVDKIDKLYGLKEVQNVMLFVGRLHKTKNFDFLLESLNKLKELFGTNFLLLAVGNGNFSAYEKQIDKLGLSRNVRLLGEITDREILQALYIRSDLHVCPSVIESFGMTVQEAASQKTPSVVIENIATANNITDEENGYISPHNPFLFASKISVALGDKQKLIEAGEKAYKTLNTSWEDVSIKHLETYNEIINNKKGQ